MRNKQFQIKTQLKIFNKKLKNHAKNAYTKALYKRTKKLTNKNEIFKKNAK